MVVQVKICGLRDLANARAAVEAGADYLGFVFAPTRRYVSPDVVRSIVGELPDTVARVGLFVNEAPETIRQVISTCALDYVQLCGDESPEFCRDLGVPVIRSLRVRGPEIATEVEAYAGRVAWCQLDGYQPQARGGTGTTFDWQLAAPLTGRCRIMLAGGLGPENVSEAIRIARPWGVDVSSGVETDGRKDPAKIYAFVRAAKASGQE